ncbi:MAG: hypothetical protein KDA96_11240, partial [Planctomycetaceae bacterium]|nr:hypothetical protein [Planctomycetaceae bacterium]
ATPDADLRMGIEGVMAGYILIRGESGLAFLEDCKMKTQVYRTPQGEEKRLPFAETYATMQALRFLWSDEPDIIDRDRLRQSMRILLKRKDMADLVIADLARWKDWEIQDELMAMYDDPTFDVPSIKRQIVRFLFNCSQDVERTPDGEAGPLPPHAEKALANLTVLEEKDPRTVINAKRYLIR